jgi:hypothetical protein
MDPLERTAASVATERVGRLEITEGVEGAEGRVVEGAEAVAAEALPPSSPGHILAAP